MNNLRKRSMLSAQHTVNLFLSKSSTSNTEEVLTKTYNAASRTTTFYLWDGNTLLCSENVTVTAYKGQYNSVTYTPSTGKITAKISSNTSTSNTKSGSFTIAYKGSILTMNMTQSKDAVKSTDYNITSGTFTSATGDAKYRYQLWSGGEYSIGGTFTVKGTLSGKKVTTYISGKTSSENYSSTYSWNINPYYIKWYADKGFYIWGITNSNSLYGGNMMITANSSSASKSDFHKTAAFSNGKVYIYAKDEYNTTYKKIGVVTVSWNGSVTGESDVTASFSSLL